MLDISDFLRIGKKYKNKDKLNVFCNCSSFSHYYSLSCSINHDYDVNRKYKVAMATANQLCSIG